MRKTVFLTPCDIERLSALAADRQTAAPQRKSIRDVIERAVVGTAGSRPRKMVTLNTPFLCIEARHREHFVWRIVYPEEADFRCGKLCVLSPAGMALLGAPAGRHVRLPVADGAQSVELVVQEILMA
ncbi:GreA/GreB family elongation factor [Cupriavidus sp. CV2]|uniref:GreA/GreB family elongation factor n=1 Tax=Cupriavidus ulmosensis TaxID=3065913 RepID=UPI00296B10F3|nr:GreA/GreB family elongation factor [Cupriavidus sp. CV2]MDW3687033.1 GreA/GreB family elongation factor [Cupriavidus sp. CV2]